jgi:hypothetical protein
MSKSSGTGDFSQVYDEWRDIHKPSPKVQAEIERWIDLIHMAARASWPIEEGLEWYDDRSKSEPDFFATVAWYGRFRLYLPSWKLPIELSNAEIEQWRAAGWMMSERDFLEDQASNAGGFLELAGRDPWLIVGILARQLEERFTRLEELANLPLERYTPSEWSEEDEIEGDSPTLEYHEFDRPFVVREEIQCFEWGTEKFRMLAIAEQNPEVNLPNKELFDALCEKINLNRLLARAHVIDEKLKKILNHLAKHRYTGLLDDPYAPEIFWWRHWQHDMEKHQAHNGH